MDRVLLDTNILSEILKGKNDEVARNASAYRRQFPYYTTSAITVVEMVKGFQKIGRDDLVSQVKTRLDGHEVLPLDRDSAMIAGRIYGELEKTGQPIGRADPLIAGIALRHQLVLVTGNTAHFERVKLLGFPLALQDWRVAAR